MARRKLPVEFRRPIRVQVNRPHGLAVTDPKTVAKANEEMLRLHELEVAKENKRRLKLWKRYYKRPELVADSLPGFAVVNTLVEFPVDWKGNAGGHHFSGPVVVPGASKSGRPPKERSYEELERLLDRVNEIKRKNGFRHDRDALRFIAERDKDYRRPASYRRGLESWVRNLEQRLQVAKRWRDKIDRLTAAAMLSLKLARREVLRKKSKGSQ
jgi:hypothetical protein